MSLLNRFPAQRIVFLFTGSLVALVVFLVSHLTLAESPSAMFILPYTSESVTREGKYSDSYKDSATQTVVAPCSSQSGEGQPCAGHWIWTNEKEGFGDVVNSCDVVSIFHSYGGHDGTDTIMPTGSVIYAAAPGILHRYEQSCEGGLCYGNYIGIDHGNGTWTKYAHLSEYLVAEGDYVEQNEPIARSGSTGTPTAHLHFEVLTGIVGSSIRVKSFTVQNPYACNNEWFMGGTPVYASTMGIPEVYADCTISSSYFCASSNFTSNQPEPGTWTTDEVQLDVNFELAGTIGEFKVTKHDESVFGSTGLMSLRVGGYDQLYSALREGKEILGVCSEEDPECVQQTEVVFEDDFGCHNISGYPKNYYVRYDATDEEHLGYEVVGPIAVKSEMLANSELAPPPDIVIESLGPNTIGLYWDEVPGAIEYRICRSTDNTTTDTGHRQISWGADTMYTDSGDHLKSSTKYFYKVASGNSSGWSDFSELVFETTKAEGEKTTSLARTTIVHVEEIIAASHEDYANPEEYYDYGDGSDVDDAADWDSDGLNNETEAAYGTNPNDADSDGDGLTDAEEVLTYYTDALDPDSDNDGLNDSEEVSLGADLRYPDSDYDGVTDGDEVHVYDIDPMDTDSDADGVEDGAEVDGGTDPADADSDDDGVNDGEDDYPLLPAGEIEALLKATGNATNYGQKIAIDGEVAVVTAIRDDPTDTWGVLPDLGSVFVYRWNGAIWQLEAELTGNDTYDFGHSVAIADDVIVIGGDSRSDYHYGAVYVYRYDGTTWNEEATLTPSTPQINNGFGYTVAVDGDVVAVGVNGYTGDYYYTNYGYLNIGAVDLFRYNGSVWNQETQIVGTDTNHDKILETNLTNPAIVVQDDILIIGDPSYNPDGDPDAEGGAYIYQYSSSSWSLATTLTASDGTHMDYFGTAVAIADDVVVIGASGDGYDTGVSSGSVYVFSWDGTTWIETSKLTASDPALYDYFGGAVAISDDLLVIGAPSQVSGKLDIGKAYTFRWDGDSWKEEERFTASDSEDADWYGSPVAVSGEVLLVSTGGGGASVYVYASPDPDDDNDGLSDENEANYGTDPLNADSDGDTLEDGWEVDAGISPTDIDSDDDGLTDNDEVGLGTNPASADEDNDGLIDPDELTAGTMSNNADSDDDGVNDGDEVQTYGSDPLDTDSDDDGLLDGEEVMVGEATNQFIGDGSNDLFGSAVALSKNVAVVGASSDNSASLYRYNDSGLWWSREIVLKASDGGGVDYFGGAVAVDGDVAVVGAQTADGNVADAGAAYVYRYDGSNWNQEAKLIASNGDTSYDGFGGAVAVSGNTIAVGGPHNHGSVAHGGAVYIYKWDGTTWNEIQILILADNATYGYFGDAVAMNGNYLAVGAIDDNWASGAAYIYRDNGVQWDLQATLTPSDGRVSGNDIALEGDLVVVGATVSSEAEAGSSIVYRRNGAVWSEEAILTAGDGRINHQFGSAVAVTGNMVVVGSPYSFNDGETENGDSAYLYRWDGINWTEEIQLTSADDGGADSFGSAVAADGNRAVVGALLDDDFATEAGSVFWFDITPPTNPLAMDTDGDSLIDATEVSGGTDPTDTDTDDDGLTDEVDANPLLALDTDDDGVSDGDDTCPGTILPLVPGDILDVYGCPVPEVDTDSDGVGDSKDACADTSPFSESDLVADTGCALSQTDTDDDSLTDYDEITLYDTDITDTDTDDDGLNDYDEVILYSTDPTDTDTDDDGLEDHVELGEGITNELFASDGNPYDSFGSAVAMSGDLFVVGTPVHKNMGAVYVYRRDGSTWNQEAKLTASDGDSADNFGSSVAMSGDLIFVGATQENQKGAGAGAVYVYRWNGSTWNQEAKLTASDGGQSDNFGISVSVHDDLAVVGAYYDDGGNGSNSGSAYIYRFNGSSWNEEEKLIASDGGVFHMFGYAVSVDDDLILIGAQGHNEYRGAAYLYRYDGSTWSEETQLKASDSAAYNFYGAAVSVSGDVALVGTSNHDAAYLYRYDGTTWNEETIFTDAGQSFGSAVSLDSDLALVGGYQHYTGSDGGLARLYRYNGSNWIEQQLFTARDSAVGDYYGYAVAIDNNNAVIGAQHDDDRGTNAGSVYVYNTLYYAAATDPLDDDTDDDGLLDGIDPDPLVFTDLTAPGVTVDTLQTSDSTPLITGTVNEPVASVTLLVDGQLYTASVDGLVWSVEITNALTDGTYDIVATATDLAGNIGTDSTLYELSLDTRIPVTTSFYSGTGDGFTGNNNSSWDIAHDASLGLVSAYLATTANAKTGKMSPSNNSLIERIFLPFDTSSLADDVDILDAQLKVYVSSKINHDNDGDDWISVVQTTQANPSSLVKEDFDQAGAISNPVEGVDNSERKDISSVTTKAYLTFNLNATGRSWISKTSTSQLGLREGHDILDSAFTGLAAKFNAITINTADAIGTINDPILEVSYITPLVASIYDAFGTPVDLLAPIVTVNALSTSHSTPIITGTHNEEVSLLTVLVNGQLYTASVDGLVWSAEITNALTDGTYDVSVTATDLAGNIGVDSTLYELSLDTRVPVTTTFFSGAGDGYSGNNHAVWNTAHNASIGQTAAFLATTANVKSGRMGVTGNYLIERIFLPFDTSSLADDLEILDAKLKVYVTTKVNNDNDGDDWISVVQTTQANVSSLVTEDFDQAGAISDPVEGVDNLERKDISNITIKQFLTFNLNEPALGWITKFGTTKLGLREGHDAINSSFSGVAGQHNSITINTVDAVGTVTDPILEVTTIAPLIRLFYAADGEVMDI